MGTTCQGTPHFAAPSEGFSLDLDSTIFQRIGSQQGAAKGYNPQRPGRNSHHPLLAVLAEAPCILHAWLRSGNTGASRGIAEFLKEALALLPAGWKVRTVVFPRKNGQLPRSGMVVSLGMG